MLPEARGDGPHVQDLPEGRLAWASPGMDREALTVAVLYGWQGRPPAISRSRAGEVQAVLATAARAVGLDVETLDRVAANARADDPWLSGQERALIARSNRPLLELACHWVLKEAYGKALGVGLALSLPSLTFRGQRGTILLDGPASPGPAEGWRFALYATGTALFAIACQVIPFAPAGRNPPPPLPDR